MEQWAIFNMQFYSFINKARYFKVDKVAHKINLYYKMLIDKLLGR